jgi:hypothetical protein
MKVVIPTCDKYIFCIPPMIKRLKRFLPEADNVQVVYLNQKPKTREAFWAVKLVEDKGWIENLWTYTCTTFGEVEGPFILLLDDYMLVDKNASLLNTAWEQIRRPGIDFVRLVPTPGPTLPWDVPGVGEIDKRADYSLSLQATLWNSHALKRICKHLLDMGASSAWDFEIMGSKAVANWTDNGTFLGLTECAVSYDNYVRHGEIVSVVHERLVADGTLSQ